jgi:type I restriction enzyme S subunit
VSDKNNKTLKPGWRRVKFGDVVRLSKARSQDPLADGIERYVGLEHLEPGDLRIRSWGSVADGVTFTSVFQPGQVLFGKRRAYQRKVAVADFAGVCSGDIYVLETKDATVLLPELLPFICQTDAFFDHAVGTSAGSLSPRTNWTSLAGFEFALPSKDEQLKIVEVLSLFDHQAERYRDALVELNQLKASLAQAEFVDSDVPPVPLSRLCNKSGIQIGPFGAQLHSYDYVADGIPVVMPADMANGKIVLDRIARVSETKVSELEQHKVRQADILLPRRGELDRRAWVSEVEEGWLCGTGSIRIRVADNVNPRAVFYALSMPTTVAWLKANAVGTTMPNLNSKIVASIPVKLPRVERLDDVVNALDDLDFSGRELISRQQAASTLRTQLLNRLWGK